MTSHLTTLAFVTGAGSGNGQAIAEVLLAEGASVWFSKDVSGEGCLDEPRGDCVEAGWITGTPLSVDGGWTAL
jgi:NAD(P)-dependent dehydrogenase (short-subunit alcohol dehydrogenase family)